MSNCVCGAKPGESNPDCERCMLVSEIDRLLETIAFSERRSAFYRERWESAICRIYSENPSNDRDEECIGPASQAQHHVRKMIVAWEASVAKEGGVT